MDEWHLRTFRAMDLARREEKQGDKPADTVAERPLSPNLFVALFGNGRTRK